MDMERRPHRILHAATAQGTTKPPRYLVGTEKCIILFFLKV